MKVLILFILFTQSLLADGFNKTDPEALNYARQRAQELSVSDIYNILTHPSLSDCRARLAKEAKKHDRRNRPTETAIWIKEFDDRYECEFWNESLRVRGGYDWDGYIPKNVVFTIHSHPKRSGGPRPSEADIEFNTKLGIIGLIYSNNRRVISVNYPGTDNYQIVIRSRNFRYFFKR